MPEFKRRWTSWEEDSPQVPEKRGLKSRKSTSATFETSLSAVPGEEIRLDACLPEDYLPEAAEPAVAELLADGHLPIPLAAYRVDGCVRRCRQCGHPLSVIAVRDICGRCAGPQTMIEDATAWPEVAVLRGKALVALDRRGYPRITLPDGRRPGPGLLLWAPVLRELDTEGLAALLDIVTRMQTPAQPRVEEDADALPW